MDLSERGSEGYGMGLVRSTSFGRKRVAVFNFDIGFEDINDCGPLKRQRCLDLLQKSALEDLPQEILVWIVCGVEHNDLKRLFCVSRTIREAALIAKQSHFAYTTPQKGVMLDNNVENFCENEDVQVPNAPKQIRIKRSRLNKKKLADISVALFASDSEVAWPKRD